MQVRGRWETSPSSIQYESNYEKKKDTKGVTILKIHIPLVIYKGYYCVLFVYIKLTK